MNYGYGSQQLEEIAEKIQRYPEKLSEADTRCKIIDKMLINCLGWDEQNIQREEYVHHGYIDYIIRFHGINIIIEAKKTNIEFTLPASINFRSKLSIGNLLKQETKLKIHYEQVSKYCLDSGVQYGCFTNGLQWIVFAATRTDGIQIHRSKVIVFNGLKEIKENFVFFWNIFSKEAFRLKEITKILLPEIGEISKSYIINNDDRQNEISDRNILSAALEPVLSGYFEELIGEESIEKLTSCYVNSSPLIDKPLSKTIGSAPPVFQHKTRNEASERLSRAINAFSKSKGHSGVLYVLIGRIGSGKSTFLFHFFFVSKAEMTKNNLVYYLNFLEYKEDQTISDFFYSKIEETSRNNLLFQEFSKITNLEKIFQSEIESLKKGPLGKITDTAKIDEKVSELLLKISNNKFQYYTKIFKYIKRKADKNTFIIFDNVDQLNPEIQENIIRFAFSIYQEWNSFVIISMREENYLKSKTDGALSTIQCNRVSLPRQNIVPIIIKRLEYFNDYIGKNPLMIESYLDYTDVTIEDVQEYLLLVRGSIDSESDRVRMFLEAIALGNLRNALDLFQKFLLAGNLDTTKIIGIMRQSGNYLIPLHEFIKAISLSNRAFYSEYDSPILNLYSVSDMSKPSHFTKLRILSILNFCQNQSSPYGQGYQKLVEISNIFQLIGISEVDIQQSVTQLTQKGLIENDLHSSKYLDQANAVRLTRGGEYYYKVLGGRFAYLDIVLQDTQLFDKAIYEFINDNIDSTELNNRFLRCEKFLEYLDYQENAELEIIRKITTDSALNYSFLFYIKRQYNKDKTFIIDTFERKKYR